MREAVEGRQIGREPCFVARQPNETQHRGRHPVVIAVLLEPAERGQPMLEVR